MKFCSECGNKLKEGGKFCDECGSRIERGKMESTDQEVAEGRYNLIEEESCEGKAAKVKKKAEKAPGKKKRKILPMILGSIAVIFIALMFIGGEDTSGDYENPSSKADGGETVEDPLDQHVIKVYEDLDYAEVVSDNTFNIPRADEDFVAKTDKGVEVLVPPLILDEDARLTVKELEGVTNEAFQSLQNGGDGIFSMSIELGDMHEFYDFIEVKLPLDHERLVGIDPKAVKVMSIQPQTGELGYELVEVKDGSLVFYTDHLSYFQLIREGDVKSRIEKATMTKLSQESMDAFISKVKSKEVGDKDALQMGFEASSNGIGWAGNFQTYVDALSSSKGIEKISGKLSLLGNTAFYINCAKTIYESMEYGDYGKLGDFILNDGLSYAIANWGAAPIQVAYTTAVVMKYVGDEMNAAITAKADEKFNYAAQKVHEDYIKAKYSGSYKAAYYDFKKDMKEKFSKIILKASSEDNAFYIIDKTLENVAIAEFSGDYTQKFIDHSVDYLNQNNHGAAEDDGDLVTGFKALFSNGSGKNPDGTLRTNEQIIKTLIEKRKQQLYIDLRYEFEDISSYMLKKAEKDYYNNFEKIKKDVNKRYAIEFVADGPLPDKKSDMKLAFLLADGSVSKEYPFKGVEGNSLNFKMSFAEYVYLEVPKKVRLSIDSNSFRDELETSFQFRLEDQVVEFPLIDENKPFYVDIAVEGDYPDDFKRAYAAYLNGSDIVKIVDLGADKKTTDSLSYKEYKGLFEPENIALYVVREFEENGVVKTKTDVFGKEFKFIPAKQEVVFEIDYSFDGQEEDQDQVEGNDEKDSGNKPANDDPEDGKTDGGDQSGGDSPDSSVESNEDFDSLLRKTFYELDRKIGKDDATESDYQEYKDMYIEYIKSGKGISDYDNVKYIDDFYRDLTREMDDYDYYAIVKHLLPDAGDDFGKDNNDDSYDDGYVEGSEGFDAGDYGGEDLSDSSLTAEEIARRTAIVEEYIDELDKAFEKDTKYMLEGHEYGKATIVLIDENVARMEETEESHRTILNQLKEKSGDEIKNYSGGYARHGEEYYYEDLEDYSIIVNEFDPGVRDFYHKYETGYNKKDPNQLKDSEKLREVANEASANTNVLGQFEDLLSQVYTYNTNEKAIPVVKNMLKRSIRGGVTQDEISRFYEEYKKNIIWSTETVGVIDSTNIYGDHLRGYLESVAN